MLLQKDGTRVRRGSPASATRTARPTARSTAPSALRQTWSITCERTLSPALSRERAQAVAISSGPSPQTISRGGGRPAAA